LPTRGEMSGHRKAHDAEANECDFAHGDILVQKRNGRDKPGHDSFLGD
jgi:hypothetical protein